MTDWTIGSLAKAIRAEISPVEAVRHDLDRIERASLLITPMEAILAATRDDAVTLRNGAEVGKLADLLVVAPLCAAPWDTSARSSSWS